MIGLSQALTCQRRGIVERGGLTKQPISSPFASFGRYFSFCSSLPNSLIGCMTTGYRQIDFDQIERDLRED